MQYNSENLPLFKKTAYKRLGIIISSGGSALASAAECLKKSGQLIDWFVVTDRKCGAESWAFDNSRSLARLEYSCAESFSKNADEFFRDVGCSDVLLFYTRRVSSPLIEQRAVWNIHPSLLPAFRGLHGVRDALAAGVRIIGSTLHRVDAEIDTGRIISQVAAPLPSNTSLQEAEHISYLQKVWLTLVWFEIVSGFHTPQKIAGFTQPGHVAFPSISDPCLFKSYVEFVSMAKNDG
jgi:phosphoribosylglycinamide formyltransferase-1